MRCPPERQGGQIGQRKGRAADIPRRLAPAGAAPRRPRGPPVLAAQPFPAQAGTGPVAVRTVIAKGGGQDAGSTTITIGAQRRDRRLQRNRTSRVDPRPVKDLLKGRFAGLLDGPGPQVLLEGLVRGSRALTQDGMSLLGHIFDLHARHDAIMALEAPVAHALSWHER